MNNIKIAELNIKKLDLSTNSLLFSYQIGLNRFEERIFFNNSIYIPSFDAYGLFHNFKMMGRIYLIFITNMELNQIIKKSYLNKIKDIFSSSEGYFVEFVKEFEDYKVYFFSPLDNGTIYEDKVVSTKLFKGFYHTAPKKNEKIQKYLMLNFPVGNSLLLEITDQIIFCYAAAYSFNILIGKFNYSGIEAYAYVMYIRDLIKIQENKGFSKPQLFYFDGYLLPIPSLPISSISSSYFDFFPALSDSDDDTVQKERINLFSTFISRSQILSLYISSTKSVENLFHGKLSEDNSNDNQIAVSNHEYDDFDLNEFNANNNEIMRYDKMVFPCTIYNPSYGFLREVRDYDQHIESEIQKRSELLESEDNWGDKIWDDLEMDEKVAMDPNRAINELDIAYEDDSYSRQIDYERNYFISEFNFVQKIFCVYVSDKFAVFEIIRENYFQRVVCPIKLSPFISGILAYTGVLTYSGEGDINFAITERCKSHYLKKYLKKILGFGNHHMLISNDYYVFFNLRMNKDFILLKNVNRINQFIV